MTMQTTQAMASPTGLPRRGCHGSQAAPAVQASHAARTVVGAEKHSARRAPQVFLHLISRVHHVLPRVLRSRLPITFIGYAIINGSAFLIDISFLWFFYEKLHWFYPMAVTVGYAIAGTYSLLLNRWLNFQSHGRLVAQGSRYAVGLVSQYVIFIVGLSSLLHWAGMNAELARFLSACCEGIYLYILMRLWVFRGTPEPVDAETDPD